VKKSLYSMSMAALLASASVTAWASSVTIPNSFTAGSTAVAADANANFDAVAASINDNDARITTSTGDIATNATAITTNTDDTATNTADIATNATAITTNTDDTATNTADIATNATDIETNADAIVALQGAVSCSADMVAVGPLCVDIYEASVWDSAAGTVTQYGDGVDDYPDACSDDGSGCYDLIFAVSQPDKNPSRLITWYQAVQACANVGKRLPTTAEWLMAANGTPAVVPADRDSGCNVDGIAGGNELGTTGQSASAGAPDACVSSTGAFDMLGNVWEWSANMATIPNATTTDFDEDNIDDGEAIILGSAYNLGIVNTHSVSVADSGPLDFRDSIGFRCVR
jgi:hypothetical protein